ncbi:MAG TPA: hypothetical protein VK809_05345 [Bacteroidia bacterium]|jgi:hypothetical protein|nr:hypothetical protein [Bacteroidia bacterium]
MKNIFLFCTAAFFLFSCSGTKERKVIKKKNDLDMYYLKGKVKSVMQSDYSATDSAGQVLKGSLTENKKWVFDKKGNCIEMRIHHFSDSSESFYICKFDSGEHLLLDSNNEFMGTIWNKYLYDNKGNRIERDEYYSDSGKNKKGLIEIYIVDEKGNKIEEDSYWGNKDSLNYKAYIKYDEEGQETENENFDYKGNPFVKTIRVYDKKGNQTEYRLYKRDSLESKTFFTYDSSGNWLLDSAVKATGKLLRKQVRKYDNKDNVTEAAFYKTDGTMESTYNFSHENFDKQSNWLKEVLMTDGKPTGIEERTIEYYP